MTTQKGKQLATIMRAERMSHGKGHLLGFWKEVDPEGRLIESHWVVCLKCGGSIFTYENGSCRGLEEQCYQLLGKSEETLKPLDKAHGHTYTGSGRIHCEEPSDMRFPNQ